MDKSVLETIDIRELGRELQLARKRSGLTQEDAAQIIDAARTTITAIEKGERRIRATELVKLAQAYGRQVSDFVRPRPVIDGFGSLLGVQFRGPNTVTDVDQASIEPILEEFIELCRSYLELEELTETPLSRKYPSEYQVSGLRIEAAAESVALEERNRLGLGDGPIPMLRDILEHDVGIRIFFIKMPTKFSEIYDYDDKLGACMAINSGNPEERRRWSMGHGYAHFLVHRYKAEILKEEGFGYQRKPESERFADAFAKYFLMPSSGLVRRFSDLRRAKEQPTVADLLTLANYYGVSFSALMDRLEMSLVPPGTGDRLRRRGLKVREAQEQLGLQQIPANAQKLPRRYQHLALVALEKGLITEAQFSRFLGTDILSARAVAQVLSHDLEGISTSETIDQEAERQIPELSPGAQDF
jgi:Zn-dependent peptidase ImmA (M78 family)/DNA-binding XRE family transcriptional regulator